ncbi:quinol:cytochrome C oxidoreductase [Siphonobacter curvatus]|uniref:Quinol:cytochrome C oxidoreductase n=1 Tax=Siphonobacter curvatus TaxID=2094562 RepID=A0A2S7IG31_9BACT|nr:quinol:cytochrome C oxidoreductase [Siphonobacter curvatus]PQA54053.1 quinol:cytochrome C oxidoreductase [Siphonobacter curvatus]
MAEHNHHFDPAEMEEWYDFTSSSKRKLIIGMLAGLATLLIGAFLLSKGWGIGLNHVHEHAEHAAHGHEAHHGLPAWAKRVVGNLWMNAEFFTGISVIGMFFVAIQYLSWAGWSSIIKRIPEAFPAFIPFSGAIMIVLYLVFGHEIFHWRHEGIMDPESEHYDAIIAGKSWYLNNAFFLIRTVLYLASWYVLWMYLRNLSKQEDAIGGTEWWYKMKYLSRIFILVFAVTSSTSAWDWAMSIDTHWFSTMFGWYHFASWHVTGLAVTTLTVISLKEKGYLPAVNENHLHDLGKFMFAFSIFWTYVWFAQFLLIYYANLPEETIYYKERFSGYGGIYKAPFFINLFMGFLVPFLWFMTRDAKRNFVFLKVGSFAIIIAHYFDFYQMMMPGLVGANGGFGLIEWGTTLFFASAFIYVISAQLTKASLVAKNHPMLEEAVHHDI